MRIFLTLICMFNLSFSSGIFNLEKKSEKEKVEEVEKKAEEKKVTYEGYGPNDFQYYIDTIIKENNSRKIKKYIQEINNVPNLKQEDKNVILEYLFYEYIYKFSTFKFISFDQKNIISEILSEIINKINTETQSGEFCVAIFELIDGKISYVKKLFDNYLEKYYGGTTKGDFEFYQHLYTVLNSKLVTETRVILGSYFLSSFENFLKTNGDYSENLYMLYLKYAHITKKYIQSREIREKVVENNKYNSDGYYYLSFSRQKNREFFEKNLIESIKNNKRNSKSYLRLLNYYIDEKKNLDVAVRLSEYYLREINEAEFEEPIRKNLRLAYYFMGIDNDSIKDLKKSKELFISLQNIEFINKINNLIKEIESKSTNNENEGE